MNWIDWAWPMFGAACATLAAIHLVIWFKQKDQHANLAFALTAASVAALSGFELALMRAQDPARYEDILRWSHVSIAAIVLGIIAFVLLQFRAGSLWLAAAAAGTRLACLVANFTTGSSLNFNEVGRLSRFVLEGGQGVSIPGDVVVNPWMHLGTVNVLLLMAFVASAMRDIRSTGPAPGRRRGLLVCAAIIFFILFAGGWNWAVINGKLQGPLMFSPAFLVVLVFMGHELGTDLLRAGQLARGLSAAQVRLADTQRQVDMAVRAAGVGLWNWNVLAGEAWFSDACAPILGYRSGEAMDMTGFRARILSADRKQFDAVLEDARDRGGAFGGEFRIAHSHGKPRWISARGQVEFGADGSLLRVDGAIVDITPRKEAEDRFRVVVQTAPTAMLMFDPDGTIVLANSRAEVLFGFTSLELVGMRMRQILPDSSTVERGLQPGQSPGLGSVDTAMGSGHELSGRRKDGSGFPIQMVLNPVPMESILFTLAAITDLSEMRRFEHELAVQRDELAHLSRVALLAELSGSLAHELNQPLTAILSNAQAALRFLSRDPPDLEEVRDSLAGIVESDKRAGEVIRRLRALLRKDRAEFRRTDVNDVVRGVLKIVRSDLLNRNIETVLELEDDLPTVCGDVVQLQQVLLNLIVNASDAMAGVVPREITLRTGRSSQHQVLVSVCDAGHGIPEQDLERIFAPFVSTKRDGLGLGLAVCRTIITAHRGELWATNNDGRGATLSFCLPVDGEQAIWDQGPIT
ncbi:PAS domain S-box protein [Luteimonas viscosa]|uniref:histidine kinase n=1 Tax=Luteimonas viscosa TaxID=1132694 RepID=A0A5D4XMN6_9GAMM|nr:PAS domain-containing sensor histidine kinase [Luteimonas viscosa]TYT25948.1 PAS domain S-box protein [Luteimonas viscosa]